ncbi:Holliday junction resolvase RuvX [Phycisphaerales bacterium AB-hyl4]|uniref:Putative pre-16S rRNA nuclease n=1 Tax=Natronomicrosphaera hydrolytica TaxID=3242702 RepID=A0ABV4U7N6_9BACT
MRYLAIDLGAKRTGIATGDDTTGLATPIDVITTTSDAERLNRLAKLIDEHGPDALVLGMPLNMDGSPGPAAKHAQAFADQLTQRFNLPVHPVDERLSSDAANRQMAQTGLTHKQKKARRDALAAAVILQDFLNSKRTP